LAPRRPVLSGNVAAMSWQPAGKVGYGGKGKVTAPAAAKGGWGGAGKSGGGYGDKGGWNSGGAKGWDNGKGGKNDGGKGWGKQDSYGKGGKSDGGKGWGKQDSYGKGGKSDGGKGWGKDSYGKGGKDGKGKGKGKGKRGPSGPNLPRTRITTEPVTGEVHEWKGKYGWITPTVPVEHEAAKKREGRVFVSMTDLVGGASELTVGAVCQFHVFTDASGLGAEEVMGS